MTYTDGVHLMADSLEELHRFAAKLHLRRQWFQDHPRHPHYDLTTRRMGKRAVAEGAQLVTTRELIEIMREAGG